MTSGSEMARLILRVTVGGTMIAHGVRHGRTLDGTARWFGSIGFRRPRLQAVTSAAVEIGAGTAIATGIATPVAASAVVGTMAVAARTVHIPNGFFVVGEGYEYVGNLATTSVALAAMGPGRWSLDRALGLHEWGTPAKRVALAAGLGLAGAAAQLALFWRKPATAEPAMADPRTAEPAMAEPPTAEPAMADPRTAEPAMAESATAESATAEPAMAESAMAESATAESATAESATAESATAESATQEPAGEEDAG